MPPLDQTSLSSSSSSSSSSHHSSTSSTIRSGTRMFAIPRYNFAVSPPTRTKQLCYNATSTTSQGGATCCSMVDTSELRTAQDACMGAMRALWHYLSQHYDNNNNNNENNNNNNNENNNNDDVSSSTSGSYCCIQNELLHPVTKPPQQPVPKKHQYDILLRRILQQYVTSLPQHIQQDDCDIIHLLVVGCWQTQYRYAQIQYQMAYRYYRTLRRQNTSMTISLVASQPQQQQQQPSTIETALRHQIQMAEYVCTCQKEIILCHRNHAHKQQLRLLQQQQ